MRCALALYATDLLLHSIRCKAAMQGDVAWAVSRVRGRPTEHSDVAFAVRALAGASEKNVELSVSDLQKLARLANHPNVLKNHWKHALKRARLRMLLVENARIYEAAVEELLRQKRELKMLTSKKHPHALETKSLGL